MRYTYRIAGRTHGVVDAETYSGTVDADDTKEAIIEALAEEFGEGVSEDPIAALISAGWINHDTLMEQLDRLDPTETSFDLWAEEHIYTVEVEEIVGYCIQACLTEYDGMEEDFSSNVTPDELADYLNESPYNAAVIFGWMDKDKKLTGTCSYVRGGDTAWCIFRDQEKKRYFYYSKYPPECMENALGGDLTAMEAIMAILNGATPPTQPAKVLDENMKDAARLVIECMDELRVHDEKPGHKTSQVLRNRIQAFLIGYGLDSPTVIADALCITPNREE